jgi:hypothetical protein
MTLAARQLSVPSERVSSEDRILATGQETAMREASALHYAAGPFRSAAGRPRATVRVTFRRNCERA